MYLKQQQQPEDSDDDIQIQQIIKSNKNRVLKFNEQYIEQTSKKQFKGPKIYQPPIIINKSIVKNKQIQNALKNQKLYNKIVYYENQTINNKSDISQNMKIQSFFPDGSCFGWQNKTIIYVSSKGIKTRLHLNDIYRSEDLSQKFIQVLTKLNKYHQLYFQLQQKLQKRLKQTLKQSQLFQTLYDKNNIIYKKYRIKQYQWQKGAIKQTNQGYEIVSNDLNAKLILMKDLFRIRLQYLQLSNNKRRINRNNASQENNNNNESNPFDKYIFHAPIIKNQLLSHHHQKQQPNDDISYGYYKCIKYFSVFNLPSRWYNPIDQIWTYLLANKIVKHQFIYIDFIEQNVQISKKTKMPIIIQLGKIQNIDQNKIDQKEQMYLINNNMPLLGRPTHKFICKWMTLFQNINHTHNYIIDQNQLIAWLNYQSDINILYDKFGFWLKSLSDGYFYYKNHNTSENISKYLFNAIPLIIRHPNQSQRCLQSTLSIIWNYIVHNQKVISQQQFQQTTQKQLSINKNKINPNSNQLIFDQNQPEIGTFKVYANGMIVGKFIDRTILTLKGQIISGIDDQGQSFSINISKIQRYSDMNLNKNLRNPYVRYRQHVFYIKQLYQKVFYYEQWVQKEQLNAQLNNMKIANQAYITVCDNFKKL